MRSTAGTGAGTGDAGGVGTDDVDSAGGTAGAGDAGGTGVGTGDADGAGTGRRGHRPAWATRARVGAGAIPNDKTYLL